MRLSTRSRPTAINLHRLVPALSAASFVTLISFTLISPSANAQANAQWTVTNLHPAGATESRAYGGSGTQQVGFAVVGGKKHACVWSGTAASWVDLNPAGVTESYARKASGTQQVGSIVVRDVTRASLRNGTAASWVDLHPATGARASYGLGMSGTQQVGWVGVIGGGEGHASIWNGTAVPWVDLHPAGLGHSHAYGISGEQQVGYTYDGTEFHASLWSGTAASYVDLHPAGSGYSEAKATTGTQQVGFVDIGGRWHASLWNGSAASWVDLHPAGATLSVAYDAYGTRQVGRAIIGTNRASLWSGTAESWEDLSLALPSSWSHSYATSIWSDGSNTYVAGYGVNDATGRTEALLWSRPLESCYADCDPSTGVGILDVFDFLCFQNSFVNSEPYACDCDTSTGLGVCDVFDFLCFQDNFVSGCP